MAKVELKARISADAREFYRTMSKVQASAKPVAMGVAAGLGVGAAAIGGAWIAAVAHLTAYGGAVQDLMDKTGLGSDVIQKLGYAAGQTGADIGAIAPAMKGMANLLQMASQGSKTAQKSFRDLGLNWQALAAATPDRQIEAVLAAIGQVANPTRRAALAVDVLGKSGQSLVPLAGQYRELSARAAALGLIIPPEQVASADKLGDAMDDLKLKLLAVGNAAVGPDIERMAVAVQGMVGNPALWASIGPALRTASEAMADFAAAAGQALQDPATLQSLATFGQNLANGFAYAAEQAQALLKTIEPLLSAYVAMQNAAGVVVRDQAAEFRAGRMAALDQFSGAQQTAAALQLRAAGVNVGNTDATMYLQAMLRVLQERLPEPAR